MGMALTPLENTPLVRMVASWVVAFPTITILLVVLNPLMSGWPLVARTFVLVTLMVPIMSVVTPRLLSRLVGANRKPIDKR